MVTEGEAGTNAKGSGRALWMLRSRWSGLVEPIKSGGVMPLGRVWRGCVPVVGDAAGEAEGWASGDAAGD
jgi:hypothetical protein